MKCSYNHLSMSTLKITFFVWGGVMNHECKHDFFNTYCAPSYVVMQKSVVLHTFFCVIQTNIIQLLANFIVPPHMVPCVYIISGASGCLYHQWGIRVSIPSVGHQGVYTVSGASGCLYRQWGIRVSIPSVGHQGVYTISGASGCLYHQWGIRVSIPSVGHQGVYTVSGASGCLYHQWGIRVSI